jgi:hypothetical protein
MGRSSDTQKGKLSLLAGLTAISWLLSAPLAAWCEPMGEKLSPDESVTMFQEIPVVYGASKYEQKASGVQFTNVAKIRQPYVLLKSSFANSHPTSCWL